MQVCDQYYMCPFENCSFSLFLEKKYQKPKTQFQTGFLKAANTPNPSLPHSSCILRAIQEKMPLIECEMILDDYWKQDKKREQIE